MYSRETAEELNKLSMEVFGSKTKWRKMVEKGVAELVEENTTKLTYVDGKEKTETIKTPVLHKDQMTQYTLKRYTVPEVREFMLLVKERHAQLQEAIKRIEAQKKASEATKASIDRASGSATP
jgi:uncharacterized small protein (DUF1192 family)